jgi:hypothetical protein
MNIMSVLEIEIKFFNENKSEWAKTHPDKFALIKGQELINFFDTPDAAVQEGARQFGSGPFLVKRVNQTEDNVFIPCLSLGLFNAVP